MKQKLEKESDKICFIDVRNIDEFRAGHVPGAHCIPLDLIESGVAQIPADRLLVLSCQSGKRSARAKQILESRGFVNLVEMEGGYGAWLNAGLPIRKLRASIPIFRQVLLTAGGLVLASMLLGIFLDRRFFAIPVLISAGLIFAGATGWCGLALLLERMPWNRPTAAG